MSIRFVLSTALVVAFSVGVSGNAFAQRAFLFIPGIPGDSIVEGYAGWIDLLSIRQNTAATVKKIIACDVSVVKGIDAAGPALWATAASGLTVPEMLMTVLKSGVEAGAGAPVLVKLYDIRLTGVRITGIQATAGAVDSSETVTLVPQAVTLTYYTQTQTGAAGQPISQSFSCQ
jgi:type VI protein secretion system component Hcp